MTKKEIIKEMIKGEMSIATSTNYIPPHNMGNGGVSLNKEKVVVVDIDKLANFLVRFVDKNDLVKDEESIHQAIAEERINENTITF